MFPLSAAIHALSGQAPPVGQEDVVAASSLVGAAVEEHYVLQQPGIPPPCSRSRVPSRSGMGFGSSCCDCDELGGLSTAL
eukprot:349656-Pyramimonas_sp.AAC.1